MGEPGGLAGDDADAGAAVAAARHLLDATVVEPRRRRPLVLGVDLGELAAGPHRRRQHPFEDVVIDHPAQATGGPDPAGRRCRAAGRRETGRVSLASVSVTRRDGGDGRARRGEDDGERGRHGARARLRDASTCSARRGVVALCEEACCRAIAADLPPGATTVGMKVRLDHLQPSPIGATVVGRGDAAKVEGARLTFTVSASDDRGLVAVGKVGARRRRRRPLHDQVRQLRLLTIPAAVLRPDIGRPCDRHALRAAPPDPIAGRLAGARSTDPTSRTRPASGLRTSGDAELVALGVGQRDPPLRAVLSVVQLGGAPGSISRSTSLSRSIVV